MALPTLRKNPYGLDPWAPIRQFKRRRDALAEGEAFAEDPALPLIVMRGIYSILFRDVLQRQQQRLKKQRRKVKPVTPLPARPQPVTPQEWVRAYNIITDSFIDNNIIKRPNANKSLVLTPEGIRRERKYYYEDQKVRSRRIEQAMEEVMEDLVRRFGEDLA